MSALHRLELTANARLAWTKQPFRFTVIGACNTLIGYAIYAGLTLLLGSRLHYLVILLLTYGIAGQVAFLLHRTQTYRVRGREHLLLDLVRYWSINLGAVLMNALLLPLLVEVAHVPPLLGQGVALLLVTLGSYAAHTRFSFRRPGLARGPR